MCIIIFKPKGIELPDESLLKRCFNNNVDGAGIAIQRDSKITIKKSMKWKKFNRFQKQNALITDNIIYHFRIATHGNITTENVHPFIITRDKKEMNCDFIETRKSVLAHNGIITNLASKAETKSDSKILALLLADSDINKILFTNGIQDLIKGVIDNDRLIIMDNNGQYFLLGEFNKHKGIFYSNLSWKWKTINQNYYWEEEDYYNREYAQPYGDVIVGTFPEDKEYDKEVAKIRKAKEAKLLAESDCIKVSGKCSICGAKKDICYYWDVDENLCERCFNEMYVE